MIKPKSTLNNVIPYQTDKIKHNWRLKLDSNENIYGTSPVVLSAIKNFPAEDISLYPTYGKLIDKLAQKYFVEPDNILLSNGCDEAINIILNAYLEKGDEILSYVPTFQMPHLYAKIIGAEVKTVEYEEKFVFDQEKLKANINEKTKVVYVATPNNPTGELIKASIIELLIKDFPETLFIVDCTYINFAYNVTLQDYIDLTLKYDNIVVLKSFSKDFAMAGLRIGFSTANKEIIKNLKKIASPYNVNAIAIACAQAVLNDEKNFEEIKEQNASVREFLFNGLFEAGYKPYKSEANFLLCDFGAHCDFYFDKLRKNGIIVRNFPKNSPVSTCLRITIPTLGGAKYILELLNKKDVLIFNLDGVIFDVVDSYLKAISLTFKHFSSEEISLEEIIEAKNTGGLDCDWDAVKHLLKKRGLDIDISDIISVFQKYVCSSSDGNGALINKSKLLISKETFEELSKKYDMVVFSGHLMDEIQYLLEKFEIDKFFYYFITSDDLPKNFLKPHSKGVFEILEHCPHLSVKYLGASIDDIIAGNGANIDTIGVIPPNVDNNVMVNNFRHLGAKYILNDINILTSFLKDIEA